MLIAILADIHANRQAFTACLAQARAQGAERFVLLGDFVGYGAAPEWVVSTVMDLVAAGAVAIMGNHDYAIGTPMRELNDQAQAVIDWTRGQLSLAQQQFLASLPMQITDEGRLYVHAEASAPERWNYVTDASAAILSLQAVRVPLTLCGHIHRPALYSLSVTAKVTSFVPHTGVPVPLLPGRRWLAVMGSVGQPRDRNPAAAFAMLDTRKNEITYCRVPYDVEGAAQEIRDSGLPEWLAARLAQGK